MIVSFNKTQIIAELLGTYILIFAGCGSALVDRDQSLTILGIAMVWGLSLMALIYTLGHISGAHFNPAVSIAFAITGRLPLIYVRTLNFALKFQLSCAILIWDFVVVVVADVCGVSTFRFCGCMSHFENSVQSSKRHSANFNSVFKSHNRFRSFLVGIHQHF